MAEALFHATRATIKQSEYNKRTLGFCAGRFASHYGLWNFVPKPTDVADKPFLARGWKDILLSNGHSLMIGRGIAQKSKSSCLSG
jgi:hypothetical protein